MAAARTRTIKNKHAAAKRDTSSKSNQKSSAGKIAKSKRPSVPPRAQQLKERNRAALLQKPKRRKYTEEELGIPKLNMITPVGVVKPPGKKKGKVFVDDTESMSTILAIVQAEKAGQIESKMIKARQLEEIRDARKAEAEKKDQEKNAKLENAKESLRKRRKRKTKTDDEESVKTLSSRGSIANKPRKKVAFA